MVTTIVEQECAMKHTLQTTHLWFLFQSVGIALPTFTSSNHIRPNNICNAAAESKATYFFLPNICGDLFAQILNSTGQLQPPSSGLVRAEETSRLYTPTSHIWHVVPSNISIPCLSPKNSMLSCPQEMKIFSVTEDRSCTNAKTAELAGVE